MTTLYERLARKTKGALAAWTALAAMAEDSDSPGVLLSVLSAHESRFVRAQVALNPNTPATVTHILGSDPDVLVRSAVNGVQLSPRTRDGLSYDSELELIQRYVQIMPAAGRKALLRELVELLKEVTDKTLDDDYSNGVWLIAQLREYLAVFVAHGLSNDVELAAGAVVQAMIKCEVGGPSAQSEYVRFKKACEDLGVPTPPTPKVEGATSPSVLLSRGPSGKSNITLT